MRCGRAAPIFGITIIEGTTLAHSRSAKKAVRKNERRRVANRSLRSALRTHLKKAEAHLASSEIDEAGAAVANAASQLDRAVTKG